MKIVHITPFYYPITGGVEQVCRNIVEYMASKGNKMFVITYNRSRLSGKSTLPSRDSFRDVHIIRLKPILTWSHGTYSLELPRTLERLKPDIVHVHVWRHPHVFQAANAKKGLEFKLILHGHAPFHSLSQLKLSIWIYHKLIDALNKDVLNVYDKIVAVSPYEKMIYINHFYQKKEKVVFIPNGISKELLNIEHCNVNSKNIIKLLYLGRVCKEKNLTLAIKALKHIVPLYDNVKLIIAGPDEGVLGKLLSLAKTLGLREHIEYVGAVYGPSKYKLYALANIFVYPSPYEAFGVSLLEAQAFGNVCVIIGKGGQLYAAPPGKTSIHTMNTPESYARGILKLLNNKDLYRKLSRNAVKWAGNHMWSRLMKSYGRLYNEL